MVANFRERQAAAGARRESRLQVKIETFERRFEKELLRETMVPRLRAVGQILKEQIQVNLNVPVIKKKGRAVPSSRSKLGEFPRADNKDLRNRIFVDASDITTMKVVRVGTPFDYGLIHETRPEVNGKNRSFLRRTLTEMWPRVRGIMVSGGSVGRR